MAGQRDAVPKEEEVVDKKVVLEMLEIILVDMVNQKPSENIKKWCWYRNMNMFDEEERTCITCI